MKNERIIAYSIIIIASLYEFVIAGYAFYTEFKYPGGTNDDTYIHSIVFIFGGIFGSIMFFFVILSVFTMIAIIINGPKSTRTGGFLWLLALMGNIASNSVFSAKNMGYLSPALGPRTIEMILASAMLIIPVYLFWNEKKQA